MPLVNDLDSMHSALLSYIKSELSIVKTCSIAPEEILEPGQRINFERPAVFASLIETELVPEFSEMLCIDTRWQAHVITRKELSARDLALQIMWLLKSWRDYPVNADLPQQIRAQHASLDDWMGIDASAWEVTWSQTIRMKEEDARNNIA